MPGRGDTAVGHGTALLLSEDVPVSQREHAGEAEIGEILAQ